MKFVIEKKREEIINAVKTHDTVIIKADAGTGKTTQVPQFLYDCGMKVVVVEPRMIEALQAYNFVVKSRGGEENNTTIGCQTKKIYKNVKNFGILYCVGGFSIINKLKNGELKDIVLIIDEAHEWKLKQEILMGWINAYRAKGNNLKVVFMSASINPEKIESYYKKRSSVKTISIEGKQFSVEERTINSVYSIIKLAIDYASKGKSSIIFQSGKNEINEMIGDLKSYYEYKREGEPFKVEFIPLHGSLPYEEQEKAFGSSDTPKIIVCTNIAQSGVNPHVYAVFDNGHEKQMRCVNGVDTLIEVLISKEDCRQRKGRAGRFGEGVYYLLKDPNENKRPEYPIPEIQRLSLEKTIMKLLDMEIDPYSLEFFHKPNDKLVKNAFELLESLGALKDGKITDLGKKLLEIPTSVQHGRMLVEGEKYGCLSYIIKAVAILETGSLLNMQKIRQCWKDYSDFTDSYDRSDIIAEIDIYNQIRNNEYGKNIGSAGINRRNFNTIRRRVTSLRHILGSKGYNTKESDVSDSILIQCLFSGMFMGCMKQVGANSYDFDNHEEIWRGTYASALYAYSDNVCFGIKQVITKRNGESVRIVLFRSLLNFDEFSYLAKEYVPNTSFSKSFVRYDPITGTLTYTENICIRDIKTYERLCIANLETDPKRFELYEEFMGNIEETKERHEKIMRERFEIEERNRKMMTQYDELQKAREITGYSTMADALSGIKIN